MGTSLFYETMFCMENLRQAKFDLLFFAKGVAPSVPIISIL
jgi:hypothetical protein